MLFFVFGLVLFVLALGLWVYSELLHKQTVTLFNRVKKTQLETETLLGQTRSAEAKVTEFTSRFPGPLDRLSELLSADRHFTEHKHSFVPPIYRDVVSGQYFRLITVPNVVVQAYGLPLPPADASASAKPEEPLTTTPTPILTPESPTTVPGR